MSDKDDIVALGILALIGLAVLSGNKGQAAAAQTAPPHAAAPPIDQRIAPAPPQTVDLATQLAAEAIVKNALTTVSNPAAIVTSTPLITAPQAAVVQAVLNSGTPAATSLAAAVKVLAASTPSNQPLLPVGTSVNTSASTSDVTASLKASGIPVTPANIAAAVAHTLPTAHDQYIINMLNSIYAAPYKAAGYYLDSSGNLQSTNQTSAPT